MITSFELVLKDFEVSADKGIEWPKEYAVWEVYFKDL